LNIKGLSVAMVQPKYSLNVGYVGRVMRNFGLDRLIIIGQKNLSASALTFASHGRSIVQNAEHMSWSQLLAEFDFVIGTTAITSNGRNPLRTTLTPERLERLNFDPFRSVLVLGRDTVGLTNQELASCDVVTSILTYTDYKTLNISHALSVILYVLSRKGRIDQHRIIRRQLRDVALTYIDGLIMKSGFAEHKREELITIFKKLINESSLNEQQFSALLGLLRRVNIQLANEGVW